MRIEFYLRGDGVEVVAIGDGMEMKKSKFEWMLEKFRALHVVSLPVGFEKIENPKKELI